MRPDHFPIVETESEIILTLPMTRKYHWRDIFGGGVGWLMIIVLARAAMDKLDNLEIWGLLASLTISGTYLFYLFNQLVGNEQLKARRDRILVNHGIGLCRRTRHLLAGRITDLRSSSTPYLRPIHPFGPSRQNTMVVWETRYDERTDAITCDYDGRSVALLGWMDKELAHSFVSKAKERFPIYR